MSTLQLIIESKFLDIRWAATGVDGDPDLSREDCARLASIAYETIRPFLAEVYEVVTECIHVHGWPEPCTCTCRCVGAEDF